MKLEQGQRLTLKELAEWFGLSYSTMRNNKEKKLELLKNFASYHMEGRKLIIDEVYIDEYSKAYDFIKAHYQEQWDKSGIDTCANVGRKLYNKYDQVSSQVKEITAGQYTRAAKIEDYGHNNRECGKLGYSVFVWTNGDELLTPEERKLVSECAKLAYGNLNEKIALIHSAYKRGEIKYNDYKETLGILVDNDNCYDKFTELCIQKLGFIPSRKTQLIAQTSV